jgi:hypothetical protein
MAKILIVVDSSDRRDPNSQVGLVTTQLIKHLKAMRHEVDIIESGKNAGQDHKRQINNTDLVIPVVGQDFLINDQMLAVLTNATNAQKQVMPPLAFDHCLFREVEEVNNLQPRNLSEMSNDERTKAVANYAREASNLLNPKQAEVEAEPTLLNTPAVDTTPKLKAGDTVLILADKDNPKTKEMIETLKLHFDAMGVTVKHRKDMAISYSTIITEEFSKMIGKADLIIPLVEKKFLGDQHLKPALQEAQRNEKPITPIIVEPCLFKYFPEVADNNPLDISRLPERDQAAVLADFVEEKGPLGKTTQPMVANETAPLLQGILKEMKAMRAELTTAQAVNQELMEKLAAQPPKAIGADMPANQL